MVTPAESLAQGAADPRMYPQNWEPQGFAGNHHHPGDILGVLAIKECTRTKQLKLVEVCKMLVELCDES